MYEEKGLSNPNLIRSLPHGMRIVGRKFFRIFPDFAPKETFDRTFVMSLNTYFGPWIEWECPECGEEHSDPEGIETHCRKCGLIVYAWEGIGLSQGFKVSVDDELGMTISCEETFDRTYPWTFSPSLLRAVYYSRGDL
jgi:hypothetical protein